MTVTLNTVGGPLAGRTAAHAGYSARERASYNMTVVVR
jgi:hypothetical protein